MAKRKLDAAIVSDLQAVTGDSFKDNLFMLPISSLSPSEDNFYSLSDIELLADDIERQGLKHNLVVNADAEKQDHYYIISGHRRFEAIRFLSENGRYPSKVIPCFVAGTKTRAESMLDLIMLNATSRKMTDAEYIQQYDKLEATLRELDAAGKSVPGRMRERIASVLKVSSAQIGKIENILHNGIEEVQQAVRSGDCLRSPAVCFCIMPSVVTTLRQCVGSRRRDTLFGQDTSNLHRTVAVNAELENLAYRFGGRLINYPQILVGVGLPVAVHGRTQMLARLTFSPEHRTNFLTAITGVPVIKDIFESKQFILGLCRIDIIVNGNISHIIIGKYHLDQFACFQIITA